MKDEQISLDKWFEKKISLSIGKVLIIAMLLLLCFFVIKSTINRESHPFNAKDNGLEIESMIRQVKMELMKADTERINNNEDPFFRLKDFQMEISFAVRSVKTEGGKIDYKFVTVEGGTETGNEKVQRLILRWDAIPQKPDTVFSDEGPIIRKPTNQQKN